MIRFFRKNTKFKIGFCIVLLLFACMVVASVMAKYAQKDIPAGRFNLSITPNKKVFAVYGEVLDAGGESLGNALNFYNRAKPNEGDTITLENGSVQTVTEIYEGFDTAEFNNMSERSWSTDYGQNVKSVSVIDEGVKPISTKHWFTNFSICENFNLLKLDTSNVTNMEWMFSTCREVTALDLSSFDTSKVTNMAQMFSQCTNLKSILVSKSFVIDYTNESTVFSNNTSLKGGAGTTFGSGGLSYARIDGGSEHSGYFTYYKYALAFEANGGTGAPDVLLSDNGSFTIPSGAGTVSSEGYSLLGWATTENATTAQYRAGNSLNISEDSPYCQVLYAVYDKPLIVTDESKLQDAMTSGKDLIIKDISYSYLEGFMSNINITLDNVQCNYFATSYNSNVVINGLDGTNSSMTPLVDIGHGATVTVNNAITGSNNGAFTSIGNNATLIINGGTYARPYFVYGGNASSKLIITGGTFTNITSSEDLAGPVDNVQITGGTFGFDPTSSGYIVEGHIAVDNGNGTWTVE